MPQPRRRIAPIEPVVGDGLAAIRDELGVPTAFPDEVLAAAAALEPVPRDGRVDRRDLPMLTIDPEGSTDLDQALAIEAGPGGGHVVWYAIADVAAFVVPGGPIDREARRRGVTLYSPDGRAPLHPPALSEDLGFATEAVLATSQGAEPPAWVRDALDELPALLRSAMARASALDRAVVDHLEALVLSSHVGDRFGAVVVDQRRDAAVVQLRTPAVVATVPGEHPLGAEVEVEVVAADPVARTVELAVR